MSFEIFSRVSSEFARLRALLEVILFFLYFRWSNSLRLHWTGRDYSTIEEYFKVKFRLLFHKPNLSKGSYWGLYAAREKVCRSERSPHVQLNKTTANDRETIVSFCSWGIGWFCLCNDLDQLFNLIFDAFRYDFCGVYVTEKMFVELYENILYPLNNKNWTFGSRYRFVYWCWGTLLHNYILHTIIYRSCGKCSSLSPTLRLITLLAFFTQAEQLTDQIKTPLLQNNRNQ